VIAREIQTVAMHKAMFIPLGQNRQPVAYRKALVGMADGPPCFTGLRKTG
jgi:hypothetical protein